MIAYFTDAYNTFFPVLCHRLGANADKKAVLFIDKNQCEKRASSLNFIFEELVNNQIFDNVVACELITKIADLSEADAEKSIVDNFENIFSSNGYNINDFEELYSVNDNWGGYQNLYFNIKKIKYNWLQPATDKTHSEPGDFNCNCYKSLMHKYNAMSVNSEFVTPCILSTSQQTMCELKEKNIDFTVWNKQECFDGLTDETMQRLYNAFRLDKAAFDTDNDKKILLIKNGFGFLWSLMLSFNHKTEEWHKYYSYGEIFSAMDKLLIDLFADDCEKIFLKYHIHYCLDDNDSKRIYNDKTVSLPNIPMEIVLRYFSDNNIRFDKIIGVSSTSTEGMPDNIYNKFYAMGTEFAQVWWFYFSIYTSVLFAKEQNFQKIYCNPYLTNQLKYLANEMDYYPEFEELNISSVRDIKDALIILDMFKYPNFKLNNIDKSVTAILLNFENTVSFYKADQQKLVPIVIHKRQVNETECDLLSRNEAICVYSANSAVRRAAGNFSFDKFFKQLGLNVSVSKSSLFESIEYLNHLKFQYEMQELRETVQNQSSELRILRSYIQNPECVVSVLRKTTDLDSYLEIVRLIQKKYLVLLAVKDTPGKQISDSNLKKIFDMGFTNFTREVWTAYIGVSHKSAVLCNMTAEEKCRPIDFKVDAGGISVELQSKPFKAGNQAAIKINAADYAVNKRGINIVVFDTDTMQMIDSVSFDTHLPGCVCSRK